MEIALTPLHCMFRASLDWNCLVSWLRHSAGIHSLIVHHGIEIIWHDWNWSVLHRLMVVRYHWHWCWSNESHLSHW